MKMKSRKPTKQDLCRGELLKAIKGKDVKNAADAFLIAMEDLIKVHGKHAAMSFYIKAGALITLAKEEDKPS